jgi:hypothetical protein
VTNVANKTLVRDDVYEFDTKKSLHLTKPDFADLVRRREPPFAFDFAGFEATMAMLRRVVLDIGPKVSA